MRLPKIKISRTFESKDHQQKFIEVAQLDIPEEYMQNIEAVIGDGKSHVSVSADMSIKEFGTGAGAMVTVTLTCGQSMDYIEQAIDIAGTIARQYAAEHQKQAELELQKIIKEKNQQQVF